MSNFENIDFEFISREKLRDFLRVRKHIGPNDEPLKNELVTAALMAIIGGDRILLRLIKDSIPEEVRTDEVFGNIGGVNEE